MPSLATLYTKFFRSTDKLFSVSYTPADTMQQRWYLVQVSMKESTQWTNTGMYFCSFLQCHPSDSGKSNSSCRWWPEWRELDWLQDGSCYEYGQRVLFSPRNKPDLKKYGKLSEDLNLSCEQTYLLGPLDSMQKLFAWVIWQKTLVLPLIQWYRIRHGCI